MTKTCASFSLFVIGMSIFCSQASFAQVSDAPVLSEGDKWVYNVTEEKNVSGAMSSSNRKWEISIIRAGSKTMAISTKPVDSNMPPKELSRDIDWSVVQNINGKNTITSHPYDFPLKPGKTWKVENLSEGPDARTKSGKITKNYNVIGWVDVKVPAGTFHALKIEVEGEWMKEFNESGPSASASVANGQAGTVAVSRTLKSSTPRPASGRLYQAFWYVPEIKSHVKLIVEDYQSGGALNKRITEELESFEVSK